MYKYFMEVFHYWQYKIIAGLITAVFNDEFYKLLLLFVGLELMDIFTRWLALSMDLHKKMFPQTPCGLWRALKFMWQARKWRWIKSDGLKNGFCDKMLLYLLLLLLGSFVDTAFSIGHAPRLLTTVIVVVLASTEALSILENLSECNGIVKNIKEKFSKKVGDNICN